MMQPQEQFYKDLPLEIVGSAKFGRYPKISKENTYNMFISDGWLVQTAGYKKVLTIENIGWGRGIFNSTRLGKLLIVMDEHVYLVDNDLNYNLIGSLETYTGDVFIEENNTKQIAICDRKNIYIFNYGASTFVKVTTDFTPTYLEYQNGKFIAAVEDEPTFRLSDVGNGLSWPASAAYVGTFQESDTVQACIRMVGRGNQLLVFGKKITEIWQDVGAQLFPYQRSSVSNIEYGCINPNTIGKGENFVVWVGKNEKSGIAILYTTGTDVKQVSTDGINFILEQLEHPEDSNGFLYKQEGHLLYQLNFPTDNLSLLYDFTTDKIFTVTDGYLNYHIANKVVHFNNSYYFISPSVGNLYELNSKYTTYDNDLIPRIRICPSLRLPDSTPFVADEMTFWLEQGASNDISAIDFSLSRDGGESFGNEIRQELNEQAFRKNRIVVHRMGLANELIVQFRFWGTGRFVANNGFMRIHQ